MSGVVAQNVGRRSGLVKAVEGGGGAWTLIKTLTASGDSDLSFVDGTSDVVLDSTYPIYVFKFINMHLSDQTGGVNFTFNMSADSGSNYNVAKTSTAVYAFNTEADDDTTLGYGPGSDLAQGTGFQTLAPTAGSDNADECCSGKLWIFNPSSTTFVKHFISRSNINNANDTSYNWFYAGYGNTTSAVDAIQFKFSSGNIDAGKIKLYGIGDS